MTSFVTTATTMFNRFPLRHSRQKEPSIGSPILVDSSRPDVLQLSGDNEKGSKSLPPLPVELDHDFSRNNFTRYTTTPNFESSPIQPSQLTPPAFYHITQTPQFQNPPSPPPIARKSVFSRKTAPQIMARKESSTRTIKSVDIMQATNQAYSTSSYLYSLTSVNEERNTAAHLIDSPSSSEETLSLSPKVVNKAPRLRDSIVPVMKPLDRTFLGDMRTQEEYDAAILLEEEEEGEEGEDYSTKSGASSPRIINAKAMRDLNDLDDIVAPKIRKSVPSLDELPPKSATGAPMIDLRMPLTPMLDRPAGSPNILLSLCSEETIAEATPPSTPPTPDEHIAQLEEQRDRLIVAQRELTKDMKDIEAVLPPNPSTHDLTQRQRLRDNLLSLQSEYDGISKELYETGMMLHRAWRRRDVKLGLEAPAVLWVRRVSN